MMIAKSHTVSSWPQAGQKHPNYICSTYHTDRPAMAGIVEHGRGAVDSRVF